MPYTERRPIFHFYQIQIHPRSAELPIPFDDVGTIEQVVERKNALLADALRNLEVIEYTRGRMPHKIEHDNGSFEILLSVDAERKVKRITKQHQEQELDSWPYLYVFVDARPNIQRMAVEVRPSVYKNTYTVARALADSLSRYMNKYNLSVFIKPVFDRNEFWQIVDNYPNSITHIKFELVRPNMARISQSIPDEIKEITAEINGVEANLEFNSDPDANLTIRRDMKKIAGLVEYASNGGGKIVLKMGRYHRIVTSDEAVVEKAIEDIEIHGEKADVVEIAYALERLVEETMLDVDGDTEPQLLKPSQHNKARKNNRATR